MLVVFALMAFAVWLIGRACRYVFARTRCEVVDEALAETRRNDRAGKHNSRQINQPERDCGCPPAAKPKADGTMEAKAV
jgi:hypothetical protein